VIVGVFLVTGVVVGWGRCLRRRVHLRIFCGWQETIRRI
jgi:hypothetical protein